MKAEIITYNSKYKQDFINLNIEWLEEYFVVEDIDREIFQKAEEIILNSGGEIFFCKVAGKIVGTVAMIKHNNDNSFELAKMAVSKIEQGKGYSKLLMESCINFAKRNNALKIFLLSNKKLKPAIALYLKSGFAEVPLTHHEYVRSDIQMELNLV